MRISHLTRMYAAVYVVPISAITFSTRKWRKAAAETGQRQSENAWGRGGKGGTGEGGGAHSNQ